jgi:riboflavin transporter FmnP
MKRFVLEFLRRGAIASGIGPIVWAIIYMILQQVAEVETLTVNQVCIGIVSLTALAFLAGGMNVLYQIERLPLLMAILIHGSVLYVSYLGTYLINDWLDFGVIPIIVFSAIFVVGYIVIWAIIYSIIKRNTEKLNRILNQKQHSITEA